MSEVTERDMAELARAAAGGDRHACRALYGATFRRVHGQVGRLLGWTPAVEDVVQEVYLEVFRSLASYHGDSAFTTWLFRVTYNVAVSHLRRQARKPIELAPIKELSAAVNQPDFDARRQVRALYEALEDEPAESRECFVLYELEGLSLKEVAGLTSCALNTVASRIRRTRERLGRLLEPEAAARRKAR